MIHLAASASGLRPRRLLGLLKHGGHSVGPLTEIRSRIRTKLWLVWTELKIIAYVVGPRRLRTAMGVKRGFESRRSRLYSDTHAVRTSAIPPVCLRNDVRIAHPLPVVVGYLEAWRFEVGDTSASFAEPDLRLANRGGARISAAEIAAILERGDAIERALVAVGPRAALRGTARSVPWQPLRLLFDAFVDIRGVGVSKMTKALHPKRPALIPMLDSVVQSYLADDDPATGSVRGTFGCARPRLQARHR